LGWRRFLREPEPGADFEELVLPLLPSAYNLAREVSTALEDVDDPADVAASVEEDLVRRADGAPLRRALDELPGEFREVIVLRELEELSYRQIAEVAGVPVGTVMSRLARARWRRQSALARPVAAPVGT
jgi:RNA polymerase sigma factor (sigma-70 family)